MERTARRLLVVVFVGALALTSACSQADLLARVRDESIFEAPPSGVLIGAHERAGTTAGFGTPAGRQLLWRYDGTPEEALVHYLDSYPDYQLQAHPTELRATGSQGTLGADYVVGVSVRVLSGIEQIPWDKVILEPSDIQDEPAPGTTLIIVAASSG